MATTTHLMTVEEFRKLPEDQGPVYHELRHGEVVSVSRPKIRHHLIQDRLVEVLKPLAKAVGHVSMEFAFRALPEYELRVADVAFMPWERLAGIKPDDNLRGAPDLVIEVLSPSNTVSEMLDKEHLCFETGTREFWVVDPDRRLVKVSTVDGRAVTYRSGQEIPLPLFGGASVAVDAVFG